MIAKEILPNGEELDDLFSADFQVYLFASFANKEEFIGREII